ncbi:MAG: tetratricopeptide repeat protein [Bacteroidales bacterium]|nr:tetratricopeptide repeat protein [Bacteroidales bacterium]
MADLYYNRGLLYWRLGKRGDAMSDYNRAVALDPASPAAQALTMAQDIMDFYNTDLYNP